MRQLGILDDQRQAQQLTAYLITLGVDMQLDATGEAWALWVRDEDSLPQAKQEFARFLEEPSHARYQGLEKQADAVKRQEQVRRDGARRNVVEMRSRWKGGPGAAMRPAPLTMALIMASILISLLTNFGGRPRSGQVDSGMVLMNKLLFVDPVDYMDTNDAWHNIQQGQVWRLLTPMLLHLSVMHLVFNMLWLYQLGRIMEAKLGVWLYLALVLAFNLAAVLFNVLTPDSLHAVLGGGPLFGGMSGVVYGMFAFVWMQSRYNPGFGVRLSEFTVYLMMGWLVFCFLPISGMRVANMAHLGGLLAGVVAGLWYIRR